MLISGKISHHDFSAQLIIQNKVAKTTKKIFELKSPK